MTARRTALLVIAFAFLAAGCGSSRYTVIDPPKESVGTSRRLRSAISPVICRMRTHPAGGPVRGSLVQGGPGRPQGASWREHLRAGGPRHRGHGRVLVLDGTILSFEKGSRAKRYFIGFGAGKAFCTIQSTFTNKATGQEVLKTNFDGELSMSFFGGSADEAVDAVVAAYIDYLRDYFAKSTAK